MLTNTVLVKLIRIALGKEQDRSLPKDILWGDVLQLADDQGVSAIAADGIGKADISLPRDIKMEWAARIVMHEQVYDHHLQLMLRLARRYDKGDFRMMVLKGWGLSRDYPVPSHRPSGDLDIWTFGQWREADAYLQSKGVKIDNRHHHHSVFHVEDLQVENHYDFINIHAHRSNRRIEEKLKALAQYGSRQVEMGGTILYLPSATFNALFLLRHTAQHFTGSRMTLRQLLDWALFMEHHHSEISWAEYEAFLKQEKLWRFFNLLNLLAVKKLGFSPSMLPYPLEENPSLERVYADILSPEFSESVQGTAIARIATKMRRWWHNRWKQKLCFSDSLLSAFLFGLWAKLLKPSHFLH